MKTTIFVVFALVASSLAAFTGMRNDDLALGQKKLQLFRLLMRFAGAASNFPEPGEDITLLTWNVLSPIRIDEDYLSEVGADINLLNTDVRTYVIAKRILRINADIVHVQELQNDTYAVLKDYLKEVYDVTPFAAHGPFHWLDIAPGKTNVPNGGAIFYRKDKLALNYVEAFELADSGNIAQAAVFKRVNRRTYPTYPLLPSPILTVNIHFQHGFQRNDSELRVSQGEAAHNKTREIIRKLKVDFPGKEPIVLIAGDVNSVTGYPGVETFKARGYTDARIASNNTDNSIYYEQLVITPIFPPLEGLPIDTVFVPTDLIENGKVEICSLKVAEILTHCESEDGYVTNVLGDLLNDMRKGHITREMTATILDVTRKILTDGNDYDTKFNRAMRVGSDHLPVFATFRVLKPY